MAKLYFYYAAMNAGKTTSLLQSAHNYRERGLGTLLYTPACDTRYDVDKIVARIGLESVAIPFAGTFDFYADVTQRLIGAAPSVQCVFVDEAQFLSRTQVHQLTRIVDGCGIPVLAYGLRTDFQGNTFEGSQYLLAWADVLQELKTICFCGKKATMNARVDDQGQILREGAQVEIGGNERYVALCRQHFDLA